MKTVYKLLLTFNSIMLMIIVYLVKESVWILCLGKYTIILYLLVPVVLAGFSLLVSEKLSHDSIEGGVQNVEMANDADGLLQVDKVTVYYDSTAANRLSELQSLLTKLKQLYQSYH